MVSCKLVGRLANQCFQISNCIAFALRNGQQYHIPSRSMDERIWPATFKNLENSGWINAPAITIKEQAHDYHPIEWQEHYNGRNIIIDGYFQSEEYFADYKPEVLKALTIPYERLENYVGIHVRRGDYLQYPEHHPAQPYKYFRDGIEYFINAGYGSFIVCSDDIGWCKEKFAMIKKDHPGIEFSYSENHNALADLALLASCDHHLISNSSFSLFAHIICKHPEKFCIAPAQWFGSKNSHLSTSSLYPENCIKL